MNISIFTSLDMTVKCRTLVGTDITILSRTERGREKESLHWKASNSEVKEKRICASTNSNRRWKKKKKKKKKLITKRCRSKNNPESEVEMQQTTFFSIHTT